MTIVAKSLYEIRNEYPDLAAEIRSILLTRAQDGATISEIQRDYYQNVGTEFPICENMTEFLLNIPQVGALCQENGTRIFYMLPSKKTKHLYDMVADQRPSIHMKPSLFRTEARQQQRQVPYWHDMRAKPIHRQRHSDYSSYWSENQSDSNRSHSPYPQTGKRQRQEQDPCIEQHTDACKDAISYYQDNWNYINSRFYNETPAEPVAIRTGYSKNIDDGYNQPIDSNSHNNNNDNNWEQDCYQNKAEYLANHQQQQVEEENHQEQAQEQHQQHELSWVHEANYIINNNNHGKNKPDGEKHRNPFKKQCVFRKSTKVNISSQSSDMSDYEAHLFDFPLMGDDFLLYLARMELGCKFKKGVSVYQSGLCVSGQTIAAATSQIKYSKYRDRSIILNIGSVDIMQGRSLIQIEHDFRKLIKALLGRGITPILTTLAPLANYAHDPQVRDKLSRFNSFIKRTQKDLQIIDIWQCFVSDKQQILFDCFQSAPRNVTGARESHLFWNKIGRQRALKLIESSIEY